MSVVSEIERIKTNISNAYTELESKGATIPTEKNSANLPNTIASIQSGGGSDVEINDCRYLFYNGARYNEANKIIPICKNVTYVMNMFESCSHIDNLDFSEFGSNNAENYSGMFTKSSFRTLDLRTLDTSGATSMSTMFRNCSSLTNVILGGKFNTSKVTSFGQMFQNCTSLTEIDLSTLDTSSLTGTANMFGGCSKLTKVIINNPNVFNMPTSTMFASTPIASGTGYVYVPDDLVETYKSSTNWSTYANQIKGVSEL